MPRRECSDTPLPAGAPCGEWLRFLRDKSVLVIGVVLDNGKTLPDALVYHSHQRQFAGFASLFQPRIEFLAGGVILYHRPRGDIELCPQIGVSVAVNVPFDMY